MALMMGKLHEALVGAGADKDAAREAAEEVANYDNRISKVESDLALLKWMLGFNIAMTFAILWRVFSVRIAPAFGSADLRLKRSETECEARVIARAFFLRKLLGVKESQALCESLAWVGLQWGERS